MGIIEILILAVALAMDCFAVSIVCGVIMKKVEWQEIIRTSFLFGFFQAAMPFMGWWLSHYFAEYIADYDHWVAFAMLLFIGVKMIRESFLPEEKRSFDPCSLKVQLYLAVATSIDALAVGISFAMTGYDTIGSMTYPLVAIGIVSMIAGLIGHLLGIKFGMVINDRLKPELIGGIILICIGLRILLPEII